MESLFSLKELYEKKSYEKIADVLMDYLVTDDSLIIYDDNDNEEDKDAIPRPILLHILVESLWVMEKFDVIYCFAL